MTPEGHKQEISADDLYMHLAAEVEQILGKVLGYPPYPDAD